MHISPNNLPHTHEVIDPATFAVVLIAAIASIVATIYAGRHWLSAAKVGRAEGR